MNNKCVRCQGEGSVSVVVEWSNGLGMSAERCAVCNGTGDMGTLAEILDRMTKAEAGYTKAQKELDQDRTHVALYLMQESGELGKLSATHRPCDGPETTLKLAPNPGRWGWEEYMQKIAKKAPRIK